ncbi:MAG: MazG nucleotide pyrophosphohydrolase domain-containing protein [Alphaproteobacteria bacterium]
MRPIDYDQFVRKTDQYSLKAPKERHAIALYGLVGEIGSLISAIKKKILAEGGEADWDQPNKEIKEEIGDVLWYCYSLSQIVNATYFDILTNDISVLRREIEGGNERAEKISAALAALDPKSKNEFLSAAALFPISNDFSFDAYQALAFKTARTDGIILLEVCLAVLPQLGAELLRSTLPEVELTLNKNIADRAPNVVLGEVAWHLSAISSLYNLSLNDVVDFNCQKVSFRSERGNPASLHDEGRKEQEQFPRKFSITFVGIEKGLSRMYFEGHRLGNDLTDNAKEDDGYRFHDVLHLSLIGHLGWSPVFRGFMKKRRPDVDEVEDGGRAKVVEELVIKAIHSEGVSQARESGRCSVGTPMRLFPEKSTIPFRLLKTIDLWVEDLEVRQNRFWEWEDAIHEGCEIFFKLCEHGQGTVHVDLKNRSLTFESLVTPGVQGLTVGLGMGVGDASAGGILTEVDKTFAEGLSGLAQVVAAKRALFEALGLSNPPVSMWLQVDIRVVDGNKISVSARGDVQERIWSMQVVDYKAAFVNMTDNVLCTIAAIADVEDLRK